MHEVRCLWGLGPGSAICLPSYLPVGDRPGLSETVLPCAPRILAQTGLASASCSITACKAKLQNMSFVSLHFQKKNSKKWLIRLVETMWEGTEVADGKAISGGCNQNKTVEICPGWSHTCTSRVPGLSRGVTSLCAALVRQKPGLNNILRVRLAKAEPPELWGSSRGTATV